MDFSTHEGLLLQGLPGVQFTRGNLKKRPLVACLGLYVGLSCYMYLANWMQAGFLRGNYDINEAYFVIPKTDWSLIGRAGKHITTKSENAWVRTDGSATYDFFYASYSSSDSSTSDLGKALTEFQRYAGGSVDLNTDDVTGIAVVTLNNPDKKNALSGTMMVQMEDVVSRLERWQGGKGVIFRGASQFFCSGVELGMVRAMVSKDDNVHLMATLMQDITSRVLSLPLVSVALIEGGALGGGAELSSSCDYRVATDKSKISFLHVKLGVVPGFGGVTRLVQILGRRKALDLLCSSRTLTAGDAEALGFVDNVISSDTSEDALDKTKQWISTLCRGNAVPVRAVKTMVHGASSLPTETSLHQEKEIFSRVWGNPVHCKAIGLDKK